MSTLYVFCLLTASCANIYFDNPMPLQGSKIKTFSDLSGTYAFADTIAEIKDRIYYNTDYYKNDYKGRDSMHLISGILYFEGQQMGYKLHLRSYYKMNKIDTARVITANKTAKKSIENNYLILDYYPANTLIDLNTQDELKFFNGNYYANKFNQKKKWEVAQISLAEETIYLNFIKWEETKKFNQYIHWANIAHMEDDIFSNFVSAGGFQARLKFKKHGTSH